jgi:hypothetical protein
MSLNLTDKAGLNFQTKPGKVQIRHTGTLPNMYAADIDPANLYVQGTSLYKVKSSIVDTNGGLTIPDSTALTLTDHFDVLTGTGGGADLATANTWTAKQTFNSTATTASIRLPLTATPSALVEGDLFYKNGPEGLHFQQGNVTTRILASVRPQDVTTVTATNSATAVDLVSWAIPAGFWGGTKRVTVELELRYSTAATAPTLTLGGVIGSTVMITDTAISLPANITDGYGIFRLTLSCNSVGVSGNIAKTAAVELVTNNTNGTNVKYGLNPQASLSVDTTAIQNFIIRATWNAASTSNTLAARLAIISIL